MLSRSFKVVAPGVFELYVEDINADKDECLIRIEKAAICKADIRYYKGNRDEKILGLKYPMALIHEVVGTVIKDKSGEFKTGDKVVLVPNILKSKDKAKCNHKVCEAPSLGENYCEMAKFASSNCDGFSKEIVALPKTNVIKVGGDLDSNVAVFSELISVAVSIFRRIDFLSKEYEDIYIWGDGILGYIVASIATNILNKNVIVIGKHEDKLKEFYCKKYISTEDIKNLKDMNIELVVECVGGNGMETAINQILNVINPGGKLILTGVSEKNVSIDTRKILEKGLVVTGSTRSNINDFKIAVDYFNNKEFLKSIENLIADAIEIKDITDFYFVFEKTCSNNILGKYVMNFMF